MFYHLKWSTLNNILQTILSSTKEIKKIDVIIGRQNFFDQPVRNDLITYGNTRKIATGQWDDYTTGCLLNHNYFKNYYEMIAIDLRKQEPLDPDPKTIQ